MHPADGLLNIIWKVVTSQADSESILGLCRAASGGRTTEYYLHVNGVLGR